MSVIPALKRFYISSFWREQESFFQRIKKISEGSFFSSTRKRQTLMVERFKKFMAGCQIIEFYAQLEMEIANCHVIFDRHLVRELVAFRDYVWQSVFEPLKLPYRGKDYVKLVKDLSEKSNPTDRRAAQRKIGDCYIHLRDTIVTDPIDRSGELQVRVVQKKFWDFVAGDTQPKSESAELINDFMTPQAAKEKITGVAATFISSSTESTNLIHRARCAWLYLHSSSHNYEKLLGIAIELLRSQQLVWKFEYSSHNPTEETLEVIPLLYTAVFDSAYRVSPKPDKTAIPKQSRLHTGEEIERQKKLVVKQIATQSDVKKLKSKEEAVKRRTKLFDTKVYLLDSLRDDRESVAFLESLLKGRSVSKGDKLKIEKLLLYWPRKREEHFQSSGPEASARVCAQADQRLPNAEHSINSTAASFKIIPVSN